MSSSGIHRRVRAGRLHRLHRGVYAVGHLAVSFRARLMAATLACGAEALLSHRSTGRLRGLLSSSTSRIEVTAPNGGRAREDVVIHRTRVLHPDDRALLHGIPVTSLARTVVDLAEVLHPRRLADVLHQAEVRGLLDLGAIEAALERVPGRRGGPVLLEALAAYRPEDHAAESEGERRLLQLCRDHGLPMPRSNQLVDGYRLDALWPEARLALEFDGAEFHNTRRAFHEDRARDRALAEAGYQVLRVTWPDLERPARLARQLAAIHAVRYTLPGEPPKGARHE